MEGKSIRLRLRPEEYELVVAHREGVTPPAVAAEASREVAKLKQAVQSYKRAAQEHIKHIHALEDRYEALKDFQDNKVSTVTTSLEKKKGESQSWAVALLSDIHIEERVLPEKIHRKNSYSLPTAERRIRSYFKNIEYLVSTQRASTEIHGLIVAVLGDLLSGYIHEELEETNQCTPIEAAILVTSLIEEGLLFLAEHGGFTEIRVPCVVGNHGRTTHKIRAKSAAENNYETFVYMSLAKTFKEHPVVKVDVAAGRQLIIGVWDDFKIRLHHGDSIRGGGGIGGIDVPIKRYLAKLGSAGGVNLDCMGHFHQLVFGTNYILNGSVIGYSEYALQGGYQYERPQQAFFLVEKDHGLTVRAPILME